MVSCFARAYHTGANACPVFSDTAAHALPGSDYEAIAQSMLEGMDFFLPDFRGTAEEGLRAVCAFCRRLPVGGEDICQPFGHKLLSAQG